MLVYWAMFAVPALASLSPWRLTQQSRLLVLLMTSALLVVIIGLRDHVGADWDGYTYWMQDAETHSLWELLTAKEPGFGLIDWVNIQLGWGQAGVDVMCSVIFVAGLIEFLQRQPNIWRCLTLAIPVLIIQLAMSSIRQAAAIGLLFFAMNAFVDRRVFRYLIFVLLAFTMHQTSIVFILMAIFINHRVQAIPAVASAILLVAIVAYIFKDLGYYSTYILPDVNSALYAALGAMPRIAFNILAVALFWRFSRLWSAHYPDHRLYSILAAVTLGISPFLFFAQVAIDRLEYYLIPFQIAVIGRAPEFLQPSARAPFMLCVYGGYAAALAVWLNYSPLAQAAWLPYHSFLF
jgi:hypothetical protein